MAYNNREKIQAELFELQDEKYRDFHSKLIPDMEKENIIGIRTPVLRKYAKQFAKTEDAGLTVGDFCGSVCVKFFWRKSCQRKKYLKLR